MSERNTLNRITHDDYLRAEGAQMAIRLLCDMFEGHDPCFYRKTDGVVEKSKPTLPYQWLDAVRRFTSNIFGAVDFINQSRDIVWHPVFSEKKGKLVVERIDIIDKYMKK